MKFGKKQIFIIGLALAVILGSWFYYFRVLRVNYLIPGVPYNGIYNLFFQNAYLPETPSVLDILGYWGDERFTIPDLKEEFPSSISATSTPVSLITLKSGIKKFFTENGYEASDWLSVEPANVIKEIKRFVNPEKKIPVIVLTKQTLDEKNNISLFFMQVVIGVFDNSRKVILHDSYYGNNYEILYDDFEKMFQGGTGILAVWPSDKIEGLIKGPNYNLAYPQRLESMDRVGALLATKRRLAIIKFQQTGSFEQSIAAWKDFFNDPNFKYLPPAFQIVQLTRFVKTHYIDLNQPDEAIKIINEQILPLNKNLSQTLQGWSGVSVDEFSSPYYVLSLAYLKEGEHDLAINSYEKMKLISTSIREKLGEDNYFGLPPIEELEK